MMIDDITKERMLVSRGGKAGPYIIAPESQLPQVKKLLDQHGITHTVEGDAISIGGKPYVVIISLGLEGNVQHVQAVLDACKNPQELDS